MFYIRSNTSIHRHVCCRHEIEIQSFQNIGRNNRLDTKLIFMRIFFVCFCLNEIWLNIIWDLAGKTSICQGLVKRKVFHWLREFLNLKVYLSTRLNILSALCNNVLTTLGRSGYLRWYGRIIKLRESSSSEIHHHNCF